MNCLNIGCGKDIKANWVNLDKANLPGVDVVHDLEVLPLPFEDDRFDRILAKDVLEHVDYIPLLKELHRILRTGGELLIQVPHFTSVDNFIDPTHKHSFSIRTFEFFLSHSVLGREYYFDFGFQRITDRHISFFRGPLLWNYFVEPLINTCYKAQKYYELTFVSRMFPAQNVVLTLVK